MVKIEAGSFAYPFFFHTNENVIGINIQATNQTNNISPKVNQIIDLFHLLKSH